MTNRFQKFRELGSKGKRSNPLLLEEFQWKNEWVDINFDPVHAFNDINWTHVDEVVDATEQLRGRNMPREATAHARNSVVTHTYGRNRKRKTRLDAPGDDSSGHEEEEDRAATK